jgi:hypothetical protein
VAEVIYGSDDPTNVDDSNLGDRGFVVSTDQHDAELGGVVAGAGDVNGDDVADVLITAPRSSPGGRRGAGAAYVVFGSRDQTGDLSVDALGARGFEIDGATRVGGAQQQVPLGLGSSAAAAGDVNGDGLADVVLGSPGATSPGASAYLVLGADDPSPLDLGNPGGRAEAVEMDTAEQFGLLQVAGNLDFDGNGSDDFLLGQSSSDGTHRAYVVGGG